jgi:pimeloyl-ACP methyl ester carboxylesterase
MTRTISLAGTTLELIERGQGRSLLFLHAGEGLAPERPWLDLLAKRYRVIAPSHPGYGNSPLILKTRNHVLHHPSEQVRQNNHRMV